MTDEELRALLDAATKGPWQVDLEYVGDVLGDTGKCVVCEWASSPNARLIAAAPDLAAEVLRLRVALDDIRCGRGMFGLDPAEDLKWAMKTAGTALGDAP